MDWTQTLTIIFTVMGSTYAFYHIIKEDIKRHDIEIQDSRNKHDLEFREVREEFREMRSEFSKVHSLWASLLKEIHDIKLDQSRKA